MAENMQRGVSKGKYMFEPEIDSEVLGGTKIYVDLKKYGEPLYLIIQDKGRIEVRKSKLKEFALELLDIAETYSGNWNAQMFRK